MVLGAMHLIRPCAVCLLVVLVAGAAAAASPGLEGVRELIDEGRIAPAAARVRAYLARHPRDLRARFLRGLVLAKQGRNEPATEVFSRLAREYPDLPEPYNNLAVLYAARGEYAKAREALVRAINTHPSYATAQKNLREVYARLAGIAYDKALHLDGRKGSAPAKLALVGDLFSTAEPKPPVTAVAAAERIPPVTAAAATKRKPSVTATKRKSPVTAAAAIKRKPPVTAAAATARKRPVAASEPVPRAEILAAVNGWAAAWSRRDVGGYLAFYSDRFTPPGGLSRSDWEARRYQRIRLPRFITVKVKDAHLEKAADGRVRVTFVQEYRSNTYRDRVRKRLVMRRAGGGWKIDGESIRRLLSR